MFYESDLGFLSLVVTGVEERRHCEEDLRGEAVRRVERRQVVEAPVGRTKQTLKDLLGCGMSAGSVMNMVRECSE